MTTDNGIKFTIPNTRTQRLLARMEACSEGRQAIGAMNLHEAWKDTRKIKANHRRWFFYTMWLYGFVDHATYNKFRDPYVDSRTLIKNVTLPTLAELEAAVPVMKKSVDGGRIPDYDAIADIERRRWNDYYNWRNQQYALANAA